MTRQISASFLDAINDRSIKLFYAVEMIFDSGTLRLWTGMGSKSIDGNTYVGTGQVLGISTVEETQDLGATRISLSLSGVDSAMVSLALSEPYQGRACNVYLGLDGESDLVSIFSGIMDVMTIEDTGQTSTIVLSVESKMVSLDRIVPLRYTQEVQEARYPNDSFFSYVTKLQDKSIYWGRKAAGPRTKTSANGGGVLEPWWE